MNKLEERMLSDKPGVISVVQACDFFGVKHIVICPGSRNAPLTISFAQSGVFQCHSIVDERAATFFALGLAIATKSPVAIVCTSGSAVANFAPAMAEAYYQKVPLVAISADRPLEWTDQGNGQTIRQEGVLDNFCIDSFSLKSEPQNDDETWFNRRRLSEVFNKALNTNRGPIHINIPLSEPLYNKAITNLNPSRAFAKSVVNKGQIADSDITEIAELLNGQQRIMILIGQYNTKPGLDEILTKLARLPQVVILSETTSNVDCHAAIDTIDRLLMSIKDAEVLETLMPDALISMGGFLVSKKVKALLRKHNPQQHIHLASDHNIIDTFQSLTHSIKTDKVDFLNRIEKQIAPNDSNYGNKWKSLKDKAGKAHIDFTASIPYSDMYAFSSIFSAELKYDKLHLSNSSPIRYAQLFGNQSGVFQYANRGTSGIDGCTSTAAGMAFANSDERHLIITGDVSFLYDSNALWNKNFPENLKIIVINNSGGGIFRIIEGPSNTEEHEEFFEANHPVNIKPLVEAYGFKHHIAIDKESLSKALTAFGKCKGKSVLEIATPQLENDKVLKSYFKSIGQSLDI